MPNTLITAITDPVRSWEVETILIVKPYNLVNGAVIITINYTTDAGLPGKTDTVTLTGETDISSFLSAMTGSGTTGGTANLRAGTWLKDNGYVGPSQVCPAIYITPTNMAIVGWYGKVGIPYEAGFDSLPANRSFVASGGTAPYTYTLVAGALPPAQTSGTLTIEASTGRILGTPATATADDPHGLWTFKVKAVDANGCISVSNNLSFYIIAA